MGEMMDYAAGMHALVQELLESGESPGHNMKLEVDDEQMRLTRAAIAFAHHVWRTPIEEWHCTKRGPDDGEMMRINSAVVRLIRQGLADGLSWAAVRETVLDPDRTLPDGRTLLAALGKTRLARIGAKSAAHAWMFDDYQAKYGRDEALMVVSLSHMGFGADWHGMSDFEEIVDSFCLAVDDPGAQHWDVSKKTGNWPLPSRPGQIVDTAELRRLLLAGPDLLDAESARWCMIAAIGFSSRGRLKPSTEFAPDGTPLPQ